MAQSSDYTALITSEHAGKPKYAAMVAAVAGCFSGVQNVLASIPGSYDLETAVGAQLDAVGLWVGISRYVPTPISGVYFSFDTANIGLDQGNWQGPFDSLTGITRADDETYRLMIRAKIGLNRWDGTLASSAAILSGIFNQGGTQVFLQDNGDMSITIGISGQIPSAFFQALLTGGYIPIKPEGVHVSLYIVTTAGSAPLFGLDVQNSLISGFDAGTWGIPIGAKS